MTAHTRDPHRSRHVTGARLLPTVIVALAEVVTLPGAAVAHAPRVIRD